MDIKSLFLLNPDVTFLNHGSFGACPEPVMRVYQEWQLRMEWQPVAFLGREITGFLVGARRSLAAYLNVKPDDLVYFPNPTTAFNMVARSLKLSEGDEVLASDHEYGAIDRTWKFVTTRSGSEYFQHPVGLPVKPPDVFVEEFLNRITPKTKVIFLSHITSATALRLPVEPIIAQAKRMGIMTIIDGAHAPGQIPLDLSSLGADVYIGACHKWMCAPKGAAYVYVSSAYQEKMEPLVVSWGYHPDPGYGTGHEFLDEQEWQGTRDLSAFLTVPAAIQFQKDYDWDTVRLRCAGLAAETEFHLRHLTGLPALTDHPSFRAPQFFAAFLPPHVSPQEVKARLYDTYKIEVPVYRWRDHNIIRVSFQGYNDLEDAERLLSAMKTILS